MSLRITPDAPGWLRKLILAELLGPPPALRRRQALRPTAAGLPPPGPLGPPPTRR